MSRGFQGAMLKALGAREHVVRVVSAHDVVPGFRRVVFTSDTLFDEFDPGPTDYLRFWFPDPDNAQAEVQRGYTVVDADSEAGTFACDFVLHEPAGPASKWCRTCRAGDEVPATIYGSRAFAVSEPEPAGYLVIGDAASLPAVSSILETIPDHIEVEVILEWSEEWEHDIPMAHHPRATVSRVRRDFTGDRVIAALAGRDWSNWSAWVAGERATTKTVKPALIEMGFPKADVKVTAYWMHGKAFGASRGDKDKAEKDTPNSDLETPTTEADPAPETVDSHTAATAAAPGKWRSQAGSGVLKPVKGTIRIASIVQLALTLAELVPFVLLAEVGRGLLAGESVDDQWPVARLALIVLGAATSTGAILMLWLHVVDARFALDLRRQLLTKVSKLPLGWFTERNSATVKQAVTDDTTRLHYYVTHAAVDVVGAITAPVAVLIYLFVIDARLAAILLIPVIAYAIVFAQMVQASGTKVTEAAEWTTRLNGEAVSFLDGLGVVRTFGGSQLSGFRSSVTDYTGFLRDWQGPFVSSKATASLLTDAMTFLTIIVVVGGFMVSAETLSPGDLLPFLLLGTTFGGRLLAVAYNAVGLREAKTAAQRIGYTLTEPELAVNPQVTTPPEPAGSELSTSRPTQRPTVKLDGVSFEYRRGEPVLHGIDLTLQPGTITALVGASGSGKSTLAALLARFHDPTVGSVSIEGTDLRDLTSDDLYQRVGFVLQDHHVVRASLRDNIALARSDAPDADVEAAARAAQLDGLIARLPSGLDTVIGGDVSLSGGEAQRVAIARTLLADTPVVLLDEATAFADPDSEHQVQTALSRLLANRTVLVIAHRLHTIVDADRIVVLDDGRIVQSGTHSELLKAEGPYRDMWATSGEMVR